MCPFLEGEFNRRFEFHVRNYICTHIFKYTAYIHQMFIAFEKNVFFCRVFHLVNLGLLLLPTVSRMLPLIDAEVIKGIWKYIKDNDLQNPKDRREIILDKRMKKVFKVDRFDQCIMQKYLSAQIYPFNPVNLTEPDKNTKKRKQQRKGRTNASKKMLTTAQREKRNHLSYDKSKSVVNDEEI